MRNKSQIARVLYDSLSDPKWIKLRDANIGGELVSLATEIVYAYELQARDRICTKVTSVSSLEKEIASLMKGKSVPEGEIFDALKTWCAVTINAAAEAMRRGFQDKNWLTANSYDALIDCSHEYNFNITNIQPGYVMVQLPAGMQTYQPYELSVSAGSATFYNLDICHSGEQVVLYQGTPYVVSSPEDYSALPVVTEYATKLRMMKSADEDVNKFDTYIVLPSSTYPESIRMFTAKGEKLRYRYRSTETADFSVYTAEDGTQRVYFRKTESSTSVLGGTLTVEAEGWSVRFLDLSLVEFDASSVALPTGWTLLSYASPIQSLEYARSYFGRRMFTDVCNDDIEHFVHHTCLAYPGVQDCVLSGVSGGDIVVYIKPSVEGANLLFTDLERYLNANTGSSARYTTLCADSLEFSVLITYVGVNDTIKEQVNAYLREVLDYKNLSYDTDVTAANVVKLVKDKFGFTPTVKIQIRHKVTDSNWVDASKDSYDKKSLAFYSSSGIKKGWSDDKNLYFVNTGETGYYALQPNIVIASNPCKATYKKDWQTYEKTASTSSSRDTFVYVDYDTRLSVATEATFDLASVLDNRWFIGAGCAFAISSDYGTLYLASPDDKFFLNPCKLQKPTYTTYTLSSSLKTVFKQCLSCRSLGGSLMCRVNDMLYLMEPGGNTFDTGVCTIHKILVGGSSLTDKGASPLIAVSAMPTSISAYNGDLYISCDDASVTRIKTSNFTYKPFLLQDSYGSYIPSTDVPWKFDKYDSAYDNPMYVPNFNMFVGPRGDILIIALDSEEPSIEKPSGCTLGDAPEATTSDTSSSSRGLGTTTTTRRTTETSIDSTTTSSVTDIYWSNFSRINKQKINSKWNVYVADGMKETLKGMELINLRLIQQTPSFIDTEWYGPVFSGGVSSSSCGFGQACTSIKHRAYKRVSITVGYYLYKSGVYDNLTGELTEGIGDEGDNNTWLLKTYGISQVGTYSGASVTVTDGKAMLTDFVAVMNVAEHRYDRYIKLSEQQSIIWVL